MNFKEKFMLDANNYDDYCAFSWWIYLWKKILTNWNTSYFQISELHDYFKTNQNMETLFSKSDFFNSGKYGWPYSLRNAKLIIKNAKYHTNLYDLLLNHPFNDDLSLHKTHESLSETNVDYDEEFYLEFEISESNFANSNKSRHQYFHSLKIKDWGYNQIIISAICYCLQDIYIENTQKLPKTIFWKKAEFPEEMQRKSLLFNIKYFFYEIFDYLIYFESHTLLIKVFIEINIISVHKLELIQVFKTKFKEINKTNNLLFTSKKKINNIALFDIFKAFNLSIIFPDELILNIIAWNTYKNYFSDVKNMLDVYECFLEKKNLFESFSKNPRNCNLNIEEVELEKMFILDFFQLQNIDSIKVQPLDSIKVERQSGCLENQYFIKLVNFFHKAFPSFSLEKIYKITENQYFFLKKKKKQVETIETIKQYLSKIKFLGILTFGVSFFALPQLVNAATLSTQKPRVSGFSEAYVATSQFPNVRSIHWLRKLQVQANSQQQVLQQKAPAGQLHLSIANTSQRAQLAQNDSRAWLVKVFPQTQSEVFVSKCNQYSIIHGAGGQYVIMRNQMKDFVDYATKNGIEIIHVNNIVKAHLAPDKVRKNCCVSTDVGVVILSSNTWNRIEESGALPSRDLTYRADFEKIAFEEIMQDMHDKGRNEIITKLGRSSNLSSEELFLQEMTIEGHKEMSCVSAKQLASYHKSLNVKPEEGYFVFLARDTMLKMQEVYVGPKSPIQMSMFQIPGDGKKHIKPGIAITESINELNTLYIIGMAICENLSNFSAKTMLQKELEHIHYQGYITGLQASQRFANLQQEQKQGKVTGLPSFWFSDTTRSIKPGTAEFEKYLEQIYLKGLETTSLTKDEWFEKSQIKRIGDCNKLIKHQLRRVTNRSENELFQNNFTDKLKTINSHPIDSDDLDN